MEKYTPLNYLNISSLTIKGKTLPINVFSKTRSNSRIKTLEIPGQSSTVLNNTTLSRKSKPVHSKSLIKKSKEHTVGKIVVVETYGTEFGTQLYKYLPKLQINSNSSKKIQPKANSENKEKVVENRTPLRMRPKIFSPLLGRIQIREIHLNVSQALQKMNGFICKEDVNEETRMLKFYLGKGNNVEVVKNAMKSRHKWKRVFSAKNANFCWTAVKKLSIIESLPVCEKHKISISKTFSEHPLIIPQELSYEIIPQQIILLSKTRIYNKLPGNTELTNKKLLFSNMFSFYSSQGLNPFSKIPVTYHILSGLQDQSFQNFLLEFKANTQKNMKNIWIVKPGENTNRGIGIRIFESIDPLAKYIHQLQDPNRTFIIQKYIENPLLIKMRKFDIRCYALITSFQDNIQGFFYKEGYLRTSAEEFSLKNVQNKFIHLTNDAIQKHSEKYGKYEDGNKLSYLEFQEYLEAVQSKISFYSQILPKIKEMVKESIQATYWKLNPSRKIQSFELLGYDFMVDQELQVWLIEVNTNPCLELSSPYLENLIPKMLDSAFALSLDQIFPGSINSSLNDFEMIFNEAANKLLNNSNFPYIVNSIN